MVSFFWFLAFDFGAELQTDPPPSLAPRSQKTGLETQIQEIKESVELPLTHPELYEEMGIKPPKGSSLCPSSSLSLLLPAFSH